MKKELILCLLLSALGTGCSAKNAAESPKDNGREQQTESPGAAVNSTVQKPEGDAPWIDDYFDVVKEQGTKPVWIQLIDIDFDGIPELFLFQEEVLFVSTNIYQGYSYKDGAVSSIALPERANWNNLSLYKNKENGKLVWIIESASSLKKDHKECSQDLADFSDFSNVKKTTLLEWTEDQSKDSSGKTQTKYYLMPDKTEVTRDQLNQAKKKLSAKYQSQSTFYLSSFLFQLAAYDPGTNKSALDQDLFYSFVRLYDEAIRENSENGNDPDYLQVASIRADLTTGYSGNTEEFPASIIRKSTRMFKNGKKNLYLLWIAQINLHKDPEIQKTLNEKIQSQALAVLAEGKYKGAFQVSQTPYVYKNILSIRQEIRYTEADTGVSKKYYTAAAYHLETGEEAKLSDLMKFDDKLKSKIYAGDFSNPRYTHEECLDQGIYDKLWNLMKNPELKDHFYRSAVECGFIIDLSPDDAFCFNMTSRALEGYIH